jgi:hypothetical protein
MRMLWAPLWVLQHALCAAAQGRLRTALRLGAILGNVMGSCRRSCFCELHYQYQPEIGGIAAKLVDGGSGTSWGRQLSAEGVRSTVCSSH